MKKSGDRFVSFLEQEIGRSGLGGEIETSDAYSKITMDVIATAACGIDSKAFEYKEPSRFEQMGNKLRFQFGGLDMLKSLVIIVLPKLADLLGMSFFGEEVAKFFSGAVTSSIQHRQAMYVLRWVELCQMTDPAAVALG